METSDVLCGLFIAAVPLYPRWLPGVLAAAANVPLFATVLELYALMELVREYAWREVCISAPLFAAQVWCSVLEHSEYASTDLWLVLASVAGHWLRVAWMSHAKRSLHVATGYVGLMSLMMSVSEDLFQHLKSRGRW